MKDVKIVEFTGDPMVQIKNIGINNKIFYLNIKALNEIISYSRKVYTDIKFDLDLEYLKSIGIYTKGLWLTKSGRDSKTGKWFPKTYILIGIFDGKVDVNDEVVACILGIDADDIEYKFCKNGEKIVLKQVKE